MQFVAFIETEPTRCQKKNNVGHRGNRTTAKMGSREILMTVLCLLTAFLTVVSAQLQYTSEQHRIQQYDSNIPPQHTDEHHSGRRIKRMYAMCPPHFSRIGNECYFISQTRENWLDAHFECKARNSKLAEPMEFDDKSLRKHLQESKEKNYIWIGGTYNWQQNKWQWAYNGKEIGYQSFSLMVPGSRQDLKFHCAVLNPNRKFRWSAKLCTEKLNYICQHKMPFVSSYSRSKIYARWNETFPNEMANEVEVVVANQPRSSKQKDFYRTSSNTTGNSRDSYNRRTNNKKLFNRAHRIKPSRYGMGNRQRNTPSRNDYISNDIFRHPIVEYAEDQTHNSINGNGNGYRNGNGVYRGGFNVDIHGLKKDNGESRRHQHRHRSNNTNARPVTATRTTTLAPETLPTEALRVATENYHPKQAQEDQMSRLEKVQEQLDRLKPEGREKLFSKRGPTTEKYFVNEPKLSYEEKKVRRDKLRGRIANLTPEEREMFFAERAKRKRSKKLRAKNETIP